MSYRGVKGGQGRRDRDVHDDGVHLFSVWGLLIMVFFASLLVWFFIEEVRG